MLSDLGFDLIANPNNDDKSQTDDLESKVYLVAGEPLNEPVSSIPRRTFCHEYSGRNFKSI